jgi:hypothetical protein
MPPDPGLPHSKQRAAPSALLLDGIDLNAC